MGRSMRQRGWIDGVEVVREVEGVVVGMVVGRGVGPREAGFDEALEEVVALARSGRRGIHGAVRDMLRHGAYKPTGRGKPASEYLLKAALDGAFPRVSPLVDAANFASLATELPISLVDLARAEVSSFLVRRGRAGESYVFNSGGQVIDLEDLLLLAALPGDRPIANPVKDSLATKLGAEATDVLGIVYSPERSLCENAAGVLAFSLQRFGGAARVASCLV